MLRYAVTIFVSAFLLFQVQPIIAKVILPWFGGTAAVWTTCLLFFQIVLLLGYLYAHGITRKLRPSAQAILHIGLLVVSLVFLPILPGASWKPTGSEDPTLRILLLLTATIGLPYFLLSTTGPLLQAWYARTSEAEGRTAPFPYRLYALSNFGSMLALLGYPLFVEPVFALRQQAWIWSLGYAVFVVACGSVAWRLRSPHLAAQSPRIVEGDMEAGEPRPGPLLHLYWVGLAMCASTLLLAVTTHLSQNVAAIPFLWVLPLSLYLLTFIWCFGGTTWQWKPAFLPLPALAIAGMIYALTADENLGVQFLVPLFAGGLFVCCTVCHGELARLKPAPRYLTSFYLMLSIGGALGGVFVGLLAPRWFQGYDELPLSLGACALLSLFILYRDTRRTFQASLTDGSFLALAALTCALLWWLRQGIREQNKEYRSTVRNFYGVLRVGDTPDTGDDDATRTLTHGTIRHGEQFLSPKRRRQPTTYYSLDSGVGLAVREAQSRKPDVQLGVIGLGTGTLAAYGRAGDAVTFYEINPLVEQIARHDFTFLSDCPGKVNVLLGDARLTLERQTPQNYDVLAVDAFSSDAIPVHLLTKEAFQLYFRHLNPEGVLCVHVSNRYLNLQPVVSGLAQALGKECRLVQTDQDEAQSITASQWILVTSRISLFKSVTLKDVVKPVQTRPHLRLWTDDYSNLIKIFEP